MPSTTRRAALAALPLLACGRIEPPRLAAGQGCPCTEALSVVRRSWHTDVVFETRDLPAPLDAAARALPGASWLSVGFGDRAWFVEEARGALPMLGALLGGPAALLITGLPGPPARALADDEQVALAISAAGRAAMLGFIAEQMEGAAPIAPGPYPGSLFHATRLRYAASYTCNTWTADALRAAGLPINPNGMLFAAQVMEAARALA